AELDAALAAVRGRWPAEIDAALAILVSAPNLKRQTYRRSSIPKWRAAVEAWLAGGAAAPQLPDACERFPPRAPAHATTSGTPPAHPLFDACGRLVGAAAALADAYAARVAALRAELVRFATAELARRKAERGIQHYEDLVTAFANALGDPVHGDALADLVRA